MELTHDEIDILLEAMEKWETYDAMSDLTTTIFGAAFTRDAEQAKEFINKHEAERARKEGDKKAKRERSILIKAKLISMKDRALVDDVSKSV